MPERQPPAPAEVVVSVSVLPVTTERRKSSLREHLLLLRVNSTNVHRTTGRPAPGHLGIPTSTRTGVRETARVDASARIDGRSFIPRVAEHEPNTARRLAVSRLFSRA